MNDLIKHVPCVKEGDMPVRFVFSSYVDLTRLADDEYAYAVIPIGWQIMKIPKALDVEHAHELNRLVDDLLVNPVTYKSLKDLKEGRR